MMLDEDAQDSKGHLTIIMVVPVLFKPCNGLDLVRTSNSTPYFIYLNLNG